MEEKMYINFLGKSHNHGFYNVINNLGRPFLSFFSRDILCFEDKEINKKRKRRKQ